MSCSSWMLIRNSFRENFKGTSVLVHTDSIVALAVLNKGYSRHRIARMELQEIAVMSAGSRPCLCMTGLSQRLRILAGASFRT
jgi:hypothetical protein